MSSGKQEKYGITPIEEVIGYFDCINSEISSNDRTPSWDGEILIYNNPNQSKAHLEGKLSVQVKSKKVNQFSEEKQKFTLNKSDLKNYLKDGGVLFFWVEYIRLKFKTESKIHYKTLLPIDIKDILNKMGKQKTIQEEFTYLHTPDLESICRDFLYHKKHQHIDSSTIPEEIKYDEYIGYISGNKPADVERRIFKEGTYIYGNYKKLNLLIPLHKFKADMKIEMLDFNIGTRDKIYYKKISRETSIKDKVLKFGKCFTISFPNENKLSIDFKAAGTLGERIMDSKFFLEILKTKTIYLNGDPVLLDLDNKIRNKSLGELTKAIKTFEEIQFTFRKFGIEPKEESEDLLEYIEEIHYLKDVVLKQNQKNLKITEKNFQLIKIANYKIILARVGKEPYVELIDFFDFDEVIKKFRIVYSPDKTMENIAEHSPYLAYDVKDLYSYSNLNLDSIEKSLLSAEYDNDFSFNLTNEFLLNTINFCDNNETPNKNAILKMVYTVFNKLEDTEEDRMIPFINKLQAAKRYRTLTDQENKKIVEYKIAQNRDDVLAICALNILLGNKNEFDVLFSQLSTEDKRSITEFPIYNLAKKMESHHE